MKRRQRELNPAYPVHGFKILPAEPGETFVHNGFLDVQVIADVEAYSLDILTGVHTRLDATHEFVKMFDQIRVRPIGELITSIHGHVDRALEALAPSDEMATITSIHRSTT